MEEALRARLLAATTLAALVGERVDWIERPQGDGLPALTLQLIGAGVAYTHDGPDGLEGAQVQFDAWGATYKQARDVAKAALAAIEPAATIGGVRFGASFLERMSDFPPEELDGGVKVFRRTFDMTVWWASQE